MRKWNPEIPVHAILVPALNPNTEVLSQVFSAEVINSYVPTETHFPSYLRDHEKWLDVESIYFFEILMKRLACYILSPRTVLENISVYGPGTEIQLRSQLYTIALGFEPLCFLPEGLYGSKKCYRLAHQDPSATREKQKGTDGYLNLLPIQGDNTEMCPQRFSGFYFTFPLTKSAGFSPFLSHLSVP